MPEGAYHLLREGVSMSDESAFEIQNSAKVLREDNGQLVESTSRPWVKLSVAFRDSILRDLKGPALSVFLCLALHMDTKSKSHPSLDKLAEETGYSVRGIQRALKYLASKKWIKIHSGRSSGSVNQYELCSIITFGKKSPKVGLALESNPLARESNLPQDTGLVPDADPISGVGQMPMGGLDSGGSRYANEVDLKEVDLKKEEKDLKEEVESVDSFSQDPWVKVLLTIKRYHYRGRHVTFERQWGNTGYDGRQNGKYRIVCRDEDQRAWLESNGHKTAENMLVGILGERVEVEFAVEHTD